MLQNNATHEGKVVFFLVDLWQCMVDIDIFGHLFPVLFWQTVN